MKLSMGNSLVVEQVQKKPFDYNLFHALNARRAEKDFKPVHDLLGLNACVAEEIGELFEACNEAGPNYLSANSCEKR